VRWWSPHAPERPPTPRTDGPERFALFLPRLGALLILYLGIRTKVILITISAFFPSPTVSGP
jgi:hypothetical protein